MLYTINYDKTPTSIPCVLRAFSISLLPSLPFAQFVSKDTCEVPPPGFWVRICPRTCRGSNKNKLIDIISQRSEWPSPKSLQTINVGEVAEKREPSYTVGGNVN